MNIYQIKENFSKIYPNKNITFEFDKNCIRRHEIIYTDGSPNPVHHVEYNKIKITVEGENTIYVDIVSHRENCLLEDIKNTIN